jgi:hypothetical protein
MVTPPDETPTPAGTAVSTWGAFQEKAMAFTDSASTLREVVTAWLAGDKAGMAELQKESVALVAWLGANQPDTCYAKSWEFLHKAAQLTASGALKCTQSDETGGAEDFLTAGSALIETGVTIMESGDACSP